jgi:hypothetical protein
VAGDDPQDRPAEREIEAAEHERRRLEDAEGTEREPLDAVRRAMRGHDEKLGPRRDDR